MDVKSNSQEIKLKESHPYGFFFVLDMPSSLTNRKNILQNPLISTF